MTWSSTLRTQRNLIQSVGSDRQNPAGDQQSPSQPWRPRVSVVDWCNILACIALFVVALAATAPTYEMGFQDDWSYSHIAREFALNGRVTYNGWTAVMLLPQIVWSALFIKLFGFSFLIMRLSTMVLGVFLVPLLYWLGRESGLSPPFAVFATLLTSLSPLVLPMTATYLSDVPAFFLFVLCFYAAVKSWKAISTKACVAWGGWVALVGVSSGLDRQIYWLAPFLFLPVVAWNKRRNRSAVAGLGAAWLFAILAVAYFLLWFQRKPYILVEHTLDHWMHGEVYPLALSMLALAIKLVMTAGMILLPLLIGYAAAGFKAAPRGFTALAFVGALAVAYAMLTLPGYLLPSLGNIITEDGVQPTWPGLATMGTPPVVLGSGIRHLLTGVVLVFCACCAGALWKHRSSTVPGLRHDPATPALVLGLIFAAALVPALLFRSIGGFAYDRYLIPFLPLSAIPLLRYYEVHIGSRVSNWSWALLALFTMFGVATTHDAFAAARARSIAARNLELAGIPRAEISAGFEYDGWTQLEAVGYVNARQIENPAGAYRPVTCSGPQAVQVWYASMMTALHRRYFVVLSRSSELVDGAASPVGYTTWLPPARRQVFTQELPGGGYAECR
jgi:4-amino-4-deoxy-L-arabinose transferase-like glycosyltransferase